VNTATDQFVYLWEFEVIPDFEAQFLEYYGPTGVWSRLFAKSDGYQGTLLLKDSARGARYVTFDRWASHQAFEDFLARYRTEYEDLDRVCQAFTAHEASLGFYAERRP
jgi:heme-degrading monooxygenase HmoA